MSVNFTVLREQLIKKFNNDRQSLINTYNNIVRSILNSKLSINVKNQLIRQNQADLTNKINIITNKFNQDLNNLNRQEQQAQSAIVKPQPIINIPNNNVNLVIQEIKKLTKRALLIGINYKNTSNELYGCINDINNIEKKITSSYGFTDIIKLTDDTSIKPTRNNILDQIKSILNKSQNGDSVFIHFSGHGTFTTDNSGDEKDGKDELFVTIDNRVITDDEIKQLVQTNLKSGVKLFCLFDCCHSGTLLDLRYQYLDSDDFDKATQNLKNEVTPSTCIMISGCKDNQTSADALINRQSQGAMTWSFLKTINDNSNNILSWKQLLQNMRNNLRNSRFEQIPQLSSGRELNINSEISF